MSRLAIKSARNSFEVVNQSRDGELGWVLNQGMYVVSLAIELKKPKMHLARDRLKSIPNRLQPFSG
jgi:hypothetical protein